MIKLTKIILPLLLVVASFGAVDAVSSQSKTPNFGPVKAAEVKINFSAYVKSQTLNLDFDAAVDRAFTVEIYSVTGKKVGSWSLEKTSNKNFELALDQMLPSGLYIIKVTAKSTVVAKKIHI